MTALCIRDKINVDILNIIIMIKSTTPRSNVNIYKGELKVFCFVQLHSIRLNDYIHIRSISFVF